MLSKWKREAESQLYTLFQDNLSKERKAQKAHESEINDLYAQIVVVNYSCNRSD